MMRIVLISSIAFSAGSLAWGYKMLGLEAVASAALIGGALWLLALWQRWHWFAAVALVGVVLLAGTGIVLGAPLSWMLAGAMFALAAWDLTEFRRRVAIAFRDDDVRGIERRHLVRLSLLMLGGLLLASIAMLVRVKLSFEWLLLVALVSALSLTQFIRWLRDSR